MVDLDALAAEFRAAGIAYKQFDYLGDRIELDDHNVMAIYADGDIALEFDRITPKDWPVLRVIDRHLTEAGR